MLREGVCCACPRRGGASRPCRPCCAIASSAPSCPGATWPRRWPAVRRFIGARATCAARRLSMRSRPSPRRHTRIATTIHTITPPRRNPAPRRRGARRSASPRQTRVVPAPARALPQRTRAWSIRCSMAVTSRPVRRAGRRRRGASGGARRRVRRPSDTQPVQAGAGGAGFHFQRAPVAALILFRIPRPGGLRPRAAIALGASLRRPP